MSTNLAYQDPVRQELIDGRLVAMSPRPTVNHNQVILNIAVLFANYLKGKACTPFADGTDLFLTAKDRFTPDFMVVCDRDKIKRNGVHGAPDLVAEVLSPSTLWNDRTHKKDVYARCGVKEYWIVSPEEKSIEVYRLQEQQLVLYKIYAFHPDWMLEDMTEQERAQLVTQFQCSLFDDLDIALEDVFYRTF